MKNTPGGVSISRIAWAVGTLALAGCVPGAYVYDDSPTMYYGGGYGYYPPPNGYYAYPGYYAPVYSRPRVVYVDHDHRGDDCRHESHRDPRPHRDRGEQGRDQGPGDDARDREPRGVRGMSPPADRPPPVRNPCAGKKCGAPGAPPEVKEPREPRTPARRGDESRSEFQRDVD